MLYFRHVKLSELTLSRCSTCCIRVAGQIEDVPKQRVTIYNPGREKAVTFLLIATPVAKDEKLLSIHYDSFFSKMVNTKEMRRS